MNRSSRALRACAFAFSLLLANTPRIAVADDLADEADLHFQLGTDKYEVGDYKTALEHFLASNRLVPNKNVLFNIARTYEQLKLPADAYRYYVQALEGETNPAARQRVEQALARLAPNVAVLRVTTDPPGATIFVDRKDLGPRGNTPRAMGLPAGKHKIMIELPGYEAAEADVELAVGKEVPVTLKLTQILGTIRVEGSPQGAQVRLDREDAPVSCAMPCDIAAPPGRHVLIIAKDGFQTAETPVEVPARQSIVVHPKLAPQTGNVVVNADVRDALITVDDQPSGFTPAVLNVPVGSHRVRVVQSGFRPVEQTIDVKQNQQVKIDMQLTTLQEVTAASRTSESVEDAPASVTIVSSQELRAMGYPTIAEAVRGIRGIYLSDDRSYDTIGVRGFSRPGDYGNRILVMLDGHPMNDNYIWSSYVGFDGMVDLDDIDRIEVVRGPGSVLYGTGAFFGVINLVTRDRNAPTHGEAALSTVGYGVGRARATGQWRATPYAGVWASVAAAHSAGRDFFFPEYRVDPRNPGANPNVPNGGLDVNGLPADGNARGVDGFDATTFKGRAWFHALTLQWFLTSRNKHLPTGEYDGLFNSPRSHFADTRGFLEARFEPQVTRQVQLLSRAHANLYNFDGMTDGAPPDGASRDTYRGKWGGFEQRVVYNPSSALRLTVGGEVIRHFETKQIGTFEQTNASYILDNQGNPVASRNDPFTVAAGYVLGDIVPSRALKITAGARLDYYSNVDFDLASATNPRLALIVKPYERGNLKVLLGKAFRAPSVYELYYSSDTQIQPTGLKPEQVYSGELEFSHRFSPTVVATAAGYVNYVDSLIELQTVRLPDATGNLVDKTQYQNSSAPVQVLGTEYEIRREWRQGWMVAGTYSLQSASYVGSHSNERRDVPNSPVHLASLKGAVPIIGRTLMGMTRLSVEGGRPDRNSLATDPPQRMTDTGVIWDLVLSGEIERMGVRYALGAYNVADWRYDTVPSGEFRQQTIVQSGRTFLASVSASF